MIAPRHLDHGAGRPANVAAMLPHGVHAEAGFDALVADVVLQASGIAMTWPLRTMSFVDADGASLLAVWHSKGEGNGTSWLELTLAPGGLPLTRPVLETMAAAAFDAAHVEWIVVKLTDAQAALAPVLQRLRFSDRGLVDGVQVYGLHRSHLPAYLSRRFGRHLH